MPKAEVGSVKHLSNQMKAKGLQRLRWYCQVCERQMRDENGFKQHTMSQNHVSNMLLVGQDPKKAINDFSNQFLKDFVQLLHTGHGEKQVQMNHFYQEYIANKSHIHMNATKWSSLTEFAKHLGREGICRVEETEKGLHISWIDTSPDALKRQEALRRKEMMEKGDEELEQRIMKEQIKRAQKAAAEQRANADEAEESEDRGLLRQEGEKVKLSFGAKPAAAAVNTSTASEEKKDAQNGPPAVDAEKVGAAKTTVDSEDQKPADKSTETKSLGFKMGAKAPTKNVFAQAKKNALASGSKKVMVEQPKKMSEAERIMREEMDRKRPRESSGGYGGFNKKQKR